MRSKGNQYEIRAALYLIEQGYEILAKNVNYRFGEIDLVALLNHTVLVFVEVRERDTGTWLKPEETLSWAKQRRLQLAIRTYLASYQGRATQVRLDLIGFEGDRLRHFKDFFPVEMR